MSNLDAGPRAEAPAVRVGPAAQLRMAAWAGIVGPPLFTITFLVLGYIRRGEYDSIAAPVSALAAGPFGWVQQVNFAVFGVLIIVFALGLSRGVRTSGRMGMAAVTILTWSGIALILSAVFPLREDATGGFYDPTGMHTINGTIFFLSLGLGLIVLSRRLARDPAWLGLAGYALASGSALILSFLAFGLLVRPEGAPLHDVAGLVQRLTIAVWFACIITLAIRLHRTATRPPGVSGGEA
ncbi:MAG TPA: DUF998 domain-containing protein [Acidimicrobiia bacterium]|nr:DUF998 domain-containing protein [Acidimicrobiia bacterium]